MELNLAVELTKEELKKYNLQDWAVRFNDRRCSFGLCSYHEKTIYLSKHLVELNTVERVMNTVLHEIAHAILGPGHGHNNEWKKLCLQIGGDGIRCYTEANTVTPKLEHKYTYVCTSCGLEIVKTYKMQRPRACGKCCDTFNFGSFNNKYILKLVYK